VYFSNVLGSMLLIQGTNLCWSLNSLDSLFGVSRKGKIVWLDLSAKFSSNYIGFLALFPSFLSVK
jgi:hypothetical protein